MIEHPGISRARFAMPPKGEQFRTPLSSGIDTLLGPAKGAASCHEVYAQSAGDAVAASGFSLGVCVGWGGKKPILWVRQTMADFEAGFASTQGVIEFGLNPASLILVSVKDGISALQAALEGVRSLGLGAVLIELWGKTAAYDLTASRRLSLACKASGVPLLVTRFAAEPIASAAESRWHISSALSRPLDANAPGHAAFLLTLLRHRAGFSSDCWRLEWNKDVHRFDHQRISASSARELIPPLSGAVVPFPVDRSHPAEHPFRRTG